MTATDRSDATQPTQRGDFRRGDRVLVTDPALTRLRAVMRDLTGQEPPPNHHGTVEELWDDGTVLIHFDDGGGAPYPLAEVQRLDGKS